MAVDKSYKKSTRSILESRISIGHVDDVLEIACVYITEHRPRYDAAQLITSHVSIAKH